MLNSECLAQCFLGVIRHLNGDFKEFEEYKNKAIELYNKEFSQPDKIKWTRCKYWHNGEKLKAKVDFKTGTIIDLQGNVLRKGIGA